MGRIEKTVFISYRRTNFYTALAVYQDLTSHGYDVFFDYQSIDSGNFAKAILENVRAKAHFLVILSPSALERCAQPGDWLRREIETALDENRNIVPLMMEGFDFGSPATVQALTGKLASLNTYNGMRLYADYFFDAMEKLLRTRFLNVALADVPSHALSQSTTKTNLVNKATADEAVPVETARLTAEEWFERGYVFQNAKNYAESLRCYHEAIHSNSDIDAAYNNLGILLKDLKRYAEAEAAYRKAIELNPLEATAYTNLGNLLRDEDLKRYAETEAAYRKAIELNPSEAIAYSNLGLLLHEDLKRYAEAEAAYRKAIELNPSFAIAYYNLGNLLCEEKLKRYAEAEDAYCKAIDLNPSNATAYSNLGLLLHEKLKRYAEAEAAYRKAIELNPSEATTYSSLGNLLSDEKLRRYEEAEAAYRKTIELNPSNATAYSNLGLLLHEDLKRYAEAETAYRKAIELNPLEATSYSNLGRLHRKQGNIDQAIRDYHEAIRLQPENTNYYYTRGVAYQTKGDSEQALDDFQQVIGLNPDFGLARVSLFGLLKKLGRDVEASEYELLARESLQKENEYNLATGQFVLEASRWLSRRCFSVVSKPTWQEDTQLCGFDTPLKELSGLLNHHTSESVWWLEYNRACFESICGNLEKALELLKIALEKGQSSQEWARKDPDFENIRNDPRFKEVVGEKE